MTPNLSDRLRPFSRLLLDSFLIIMIGIIMIGAQPLLAFNNKQSGRATPRHSAGQQVAPKRANARTDFVDGVIVVKFKSAAGVLNKASRSVNLNKKIDQHDVHSIRQALPFLQRAGKKKAHDLLKVYYLEYSCGEDPRDIAADLASEPNVEYAEPLPFFRISDIPNDPLFIDQQHFNTIAIREAWDIVKGDTGEVIIAVVDGGVDWQHDDLQDNIWVNEDEVADNGIDDDGNGFIDDIRGWSFSNNSNDPRGRASQSSVAEHGTWVAGTAAAVTDNMTGVAGASWNCIIMPINVAGKSAQNDSTLQSAFEGITYAAMNGADIINASWSIQTNTSFGQDVIDLAHSFGALVVAAASNDGTNNDETPHVPANLNHVLSVGATGVSDRKAGFSNYGVTVDVFAPGVSILTTALDNEYGRVDGTSFSAPIVCGIAGLVKTLHPDWTLEQIREQIRVTAESMDASNPSFAGKLGKGRVNALRAVTVTGLPSIRVVGASVTDSGGDGRVELGEVGDMAVQFVNYLDGVSDISVSVSETDPNISFTNATGNIATIGSGDTSVVIFQFELLNDVQDGYSFSFFTEMSGSNYSDRDLTEVTFNPPEFENHDTGPLQTTITTQGNIGFVGFADDTPGVGFVLNGANMLFEGGLLIGTGQSRVSDCIRGTNDAAQDDDFKSISVLSLDAPGPLADEQGHVVLDDGLADIPLGVQVTQESYAYSDERFNEFVIFRYFIRNKSGAPIQGMYVGLFFDWDISVDGGADFARFDQGRSMGIVQNGNTNPSLLAATRVLTSPGVTSYRSIHNEEIYSTGNGFTDSEKWNFLSNGIQTRSVDNFDVSTITSTGPFSLDPDEGVEVAFAVIGAASTNELNQNSYLAQFLWDNDLVPVVNQDPPVVSSSVLQNPALSKYADIVVVADRLLASPPQVTVLQGSNTTNISMSTITGAESAYRGPFEFTQSGTYSIQTHATSFINGVDSTQDRSFVVAMANPGVRTTVSTLNKKATVFIDAKSVNKPTYFLAEYEAFDDEAVFRFGPALELLQPARLEIQFDEQAYPEVDKLFIYRQAQDGWHSLDSQVFPGQRKISALIKTLGDFKISYDGSFDGTNLVPDSYALRPNYPNPFNPSTTIEYDLPSSDHVVLAVFNTLGQRVKTLVDAAQPAGGHRITWDGTNENRRQVSTGVYFYSLRTENFSKTLKMILMR